MLKIVIQKKEAGIFSVSLSGPLDTTTYAHFEKEISSILTELTTAIILNMQGVNYVSSMGIGAVFKVRKFMADKQGSLVMINLQPQVRKVFETVKALPEAIFTSVEEADAYLAELQRKFTEKDRPSPL